MKKMIVIGSLLASIFHFAAPIHAAQQGGPEITQYVSRKARKVAAFAGVRYKGVPQFVAISQTSISYATNTPEEVISLGNKFYLSMQNVWLESASAQGPWTVARYVPAAVVAIVCSQLNPYPLDPYQLCALPWSSGFIYSVWKH